GCRAARATAWNARRTGKPSPSRPRGAVVTLTTGRGWDSGSGSGIRGRVRVSAVTAGMVVSGSLGQAVAARNAGSPQCYSAPAARSEVPEAAEGVGVAVRPVGAGRVAPDRRGQARDPTPDL